MFRRPGWVLGGFPWTSSKNPRFRRRDLLIAVTADRCRDRNGRKSGLIGLDCRQARQAPGAVPGQFPRGPDVLPRQSLSGEVDSVYAHQEIGSADRDAARAPQIEAEPEGSLDRRTFLRRSGLVAGGLAGLGALPLGSVRKAAAGPPPPPGATVTRRKNICTHCSVGCSVIAEVANDVWIGQEPDFDSPINRGSHCCKGAAVRDDVLGDRRLRYPVKLVDGQWNRISWDQAIEEIGGKLMEIRAEVGTGFGLLARVGEIHQ